MNDISGCGTGIPRPADVPRHGSRSVPMSIEEKRARFYAAWGECHRLVVVCDWEAAGLELQLAADYARAIGSS